VRLLGLAWHDRVVFGLLDLLVDGVVRGLVATSASVVSSTRVTGAAGSSAAAGGAAAARPSGWRAAGGGGGDVADGVMTG
jgi:hypothetical protein